MSTLTPKEEDIKLLIVAGCHFGGKKITKQMKKYIYTEDLMELQFSMLTEYMKTFKLQQK